MNSAVRSSLIALAACLAIGACGNEAAQSPATTAGGPSVPSTTPASPQPSATPSGTPTPTPTFTEDVVPLPIPGAKGRFTTLTGTVSDGVEQGCLMLTTDRGLYQLVGPARAQLRAGMTVEVDGAPDDKMMTICQQGTPFMVSAVRIK